MNGKLVLYVDQYGAKFYSRTVRDLARSLGCRHITKLYRDDPEGQPIHIGYVIRGHWLRAYLPYESLERGTPAVEAARI